jgi:oxygen-independent coproporphyrinogen-3 oxidase
MAGIYIHIPFCKQACYYCNFHFSTSKKLLPAMMKAILKEAEMRRNYISEKINTIYFGGGTPSICSTEEIRCLINTIKKLFIVNSNAEITLEANPDDIIPEKLAQWKESGINRLSIGIQSFIEEDLRWMNRGHNADQALICVQTAMKHGFNNITIDLIYGTPTLTDSQWQQNVQTALSLKIPHLSCYALTVEPKTALAGMILQNKTEKVDPEKQARHFELLMQWMEDAGYEHYEISNFAKPGFRSQHNSSYWKGSHYLGLGPSAHSFNGISREWNIANNALYINNIEQYIIPAESEVLTAAQQLNEYIMTSLRTSEGLSLLHTENQWGREKTTIIKSSSEKWVQSGLLICEKDFLFLTKKGKLLADGIASDLFQL